MTLLTSCLFSEDHRPQVLVKCVLLSCWFLLEHSVLVLLLLCQAYSLPCPLRCCQCRPGPQQLRAHWPARRVCTVAFPKQGSPATLLRHPALSTDTALAQLSLPLCLWAPPATGQTGDLHISFAYLKVRQMGSAVSPEDLGGVMLSTVTHCNPFPPSSVCVTGCTFCSLPVFRCASSSL